MEDFLKDVKAESSPAEELEPQDPETPEGVETPEGQDPTGDGRTIENVHRELSRKQDKLRDDVFSVLRDLAAGQHAMQEAITGFATRQPETKTGDTLDDMSVTQLRQLRNQVAVDNPDKLNDLDAYITERIVQERVDAKLGTFQQATHIQAMRDRANSTATDRFPDLAIAGSEFRTAVNNRLNELGAKWVENNPRAVLDVANDVAFEMGISSRPNNTTNTNTIRGRVASARTGKANPDHKENPNLPISDEELARISSRLSSALPKGKSFDPKKIKDNMGAYRENQQLFTRG